VQEGVGTKGTLLEISAGGGAWGSGDVWEPRDRGALARGGRSWCLGAPLAPQGCWEPGPSPRGVQWCPVPGASLLSSPPWPACLHENLSASETGSGPLHLHLCLSQPPQPQGHPAHAPVGQAGPKDSAPGLPPARRGMPSWPLLA